MTPRPAGCSGPDCEPNEQGVRLHRPDCASPVQADDVLVDLRAEALREDGYRVPATSATERRAA